MPSTAEQIRFCSPFAGACGTESAPFSVPRGFGPGPGLRKWLLDQGCVEVAAGPGLAEVVAGPRGCVERLVRQTLPLPYQTNFTSSIVRQIAVSRTEPRLAVAVEFREGKH